MHTDLAEDAIDYSVYDSYKTDYEQLVNKPVGVAECPYFTVKILKLDRAFHRKLFKYDSFVVYMCLQGDCTIKVRSNRGFGEMPEIRQVKLSKCKSCLIPASCADIDVVPNNLSGRTRVLEVYIDNKNYNK